MEATYGYTRKGSLPYDPVPKGRYVFFGEAETQYFSMFMQDLPRLFSKLKEQKSNLLDVRKEHIASLPSSIKELTNLETVLLVSNRLATLPPEVSHLVKLRQLFLSENLIVSLPPEMSKLSASLAVLDLRHNRLKEVCFTGPEDFRVIQHLNMSKSCNTSFIFKPETLNKSLYEIFGWGEKNQPVTWHLRNLHVVDIDKSIL